jgi:BirA family biotin operon repressor/biotin-[acetyl-CoA-carboxylase] ligase
MNLSDFVSEPLNFDAIQQAIEPENLVQLSNCEIFPTIDSTNSYLLKMAKTQPNKGYVCLAEEQISARGRRGRAWYSMPGANISCSLLWKFQDLTHLSGLSLAVGIMVLTALKKYGIAEGLQLKWPNDVLFKQKKIAGILLEQTQNFVVIGIGINLYLPEDVNENWISVNQITGKTVARNFLIGLLINELLAQLPIYEQQGFPFFLSEWKKHDMFLHQPITIHTEEKNIHGIMQGVNEKGELLLDQEGKLISFAYGEVSARLNKLRK